METQDESIDISSIKRAMLRPLSQLVPQPISESDAANFNNKDAYQHIAVIVEGGQDTQLSPANTGQSAKQVTQGSPLLASTVPDSQGLPQILHVANSLRPLAPLTNSLPPSSVPTKKMYIQSSPDDTQELSPSYFQSLLNLHKRNGVTELDREDHVPDGDDGITQRTAHTGDFGHVDLGLGDCDHEDGEVRHLEAELHSEPIDFSPTQATQKRLSQFPDSQRFKTPATAGKKRNYLGEAVESPALPRNPLAEHGATKTPLHPLGLSQAFAATQAGSSPLMMRRISEPTTDRPSPNIELQARPATASVSSPTRPFSNLKRLVADPQSHYISMEQSQAERQRLERGNAEMSGDAGADELSDDGFGEESSMVERMRRQKIRERNVRLRFAEFSSPTRSRRSGRRTSPISGRRISPISGRNEVQSPSPVNSPQRRSESGPTDKLSDMVLPRTESRNDSEVETDREDLEKVVVQDSSQQPLHDVDHDKDDEDKENATVRPYQIPETVAKTYQVTSGTSQSEESPSLRRFVLDRAQVANGGWQGTGSPSGVGLQNASSPIVAVANSQPEQTAMEGPSFRKPRDSRVESSGTHISSSAAGPVQVDLSLLQESSEADANGQSGALLTTTNMRPVHDKLSNQPTPRAERRALDTHQGTPDEVIHGIADVNVEIQSEKQGIQPPSTIHETSHPPKEQFTTLLNPELVSSRTGYPIAEQSSDHSKRSSRYETAQHHLSEQTTLGRPVDEMFASPSGRKRKRMGDIAAMAPPNDAGDEGQVSQVTAAMDDSAFFKAMENMVGSSSPVAPGRHAKRLRLMDRTNHSSGEISADSRLLLSSPSISMVVGEGTAAAPVAQEPQIRSRPSHGGGAIWDVQVSPPKPASTRPTRKAVRSSEKATRGAIKAQPVKAAVRVEIPVAKTRQSRPVRERVDKVAVSKTAEFTADAEQCGVAAPKVIAPNQVFAFFNGNPRGYFAATCIGTTGSKMEKTFRYQIQWDDGSRDEIDEDGIRRLDLRLGDQTKVNLQGWPKTPHIIRAFKDGSEGETGEMTDIRGFKTLVLAPKKRKSLPAMAAAVEQIREAPISAIYLDGNMWGQMKDRRFQGGPEGTAPLSLSVQIPHAATIPRSGLATPSEPNSTTPSTPSSRTRRKSDHPTAHTASTAIRLLPSHHLPTAGLFSNMAFAISYESPQRKSSLTKTISSHGGTLLPEDFSLLFDEPSASGTESLTLTPSFFHTGFTALLTDRHSRKLKYMQALALGLPCISGRWVEACVSAKAIVDWQPYLLSAGESQELEGAVRSRVLEPMDAETVLLRDMVAKRTRLLNGEGVVVVTGKKGRLEERRRLPYVFLLWAVGAGRVVTAVDLRGAEGLVECGGDEEEGAVRWVFVDDKEVTRAEGALLAGNAREKGRGRWRGREGGRASGGKKEGGVVRRRLRVAGNEFLCQSLIMGRLLGGGGMNE